MEENYINYDYITRYLRQTLSPQSGRPAEVERQAREMALPIARIEVIRFLQTLILSSGAKRILEIGTAVGYSAMSMLEAAGKGGSVVTIEKNSALAKCAAVNCAGLPVEVLTGDGLYLLESLEGPFDFIFIDAAKGQYRKMMDHALRLIKPGGVIVSDNVLYKGMTATDELRIRREITIIKRMRIYLDALCRHPALLTSIVPIGDGLAVSVKRL